MMSITLHYEQKAASRAQSCIMSISYIINTTMHYEHNATLRAKRYIKSIMLHYEDNVDQIQRDGRI